MINQPQTNGFKCKMGVMREYFRDPGSTVVLVASIKGVIHEENLKLALKKVTEMHPLLGVRVVIDKNYNAWFTDKDVPPIPLTVIKRKSDRQWIEIVENQYNIYFDFENGPLIRFILLKSREISDLIIISQHVICDGLSLSILVQDIMLFLSNPETKVKKIEAVLPSSENFRTRSFSVKLRHSINKFLMCRTNKNWDRKGIIFDEEDYRNIHEAYTQKYQNKIIAAELSELQTSALVSICRQNHVTVNSALSVAFLAARQDIRGESANNNVLIAVNIRNQLKKPANNVFSALASNIILKFKYHSNKTFWENVNLFHNKVLDVLNENKILEPLIGLEHISPALMDAVTFAIYGRWVSKGLSRYEKISSFIRTENNLALNIANQKISSIPGLIISNLGQVNHQRNFDSLKLVRLYFTGSTLPFSDLVVGVVTVSGKLTITLNYVESNDDKGDKLGKEMVQIMNKTVEYLK